MTMKVERLLSSAAGATAAGRPAPGQATAGTLAPAMPLVVEPRVFADERGSFWESFQLQRYAAVGIPAAGLSFVQDNMSQSRRGVVRGLHYQRTRPQGKLVICLRGEIFDVAVDLRRSSPCFGAVFSVTLSAENRRQLYLPIGFAHGFCVVSDQADVLYKVTDFYDPLSERTLLWNDPALGIAWPIDPDEAVLSAKDRVGQRFAEAEVFE